MVHQLSSLHNQPATLSHSPREGKLQLPMKRTLVRVCGDWMKVITWSHILHSSLVDNGLQHWENTFVSSWLQSDRMCTRQFPSSSITLLIHHSWLYILLTLVASGECSIAFWIESSHPPQTARISWQWSSKGLTKAINISHKNKTATFKVDGREWEVEFDNLVKTTLVICWFWGEGYSSSQKILE